MTATKWSVEYGVQNDNNSTHNVTIANRSSLQRGGFPRWPTKSKGVNITTLIHWLDFAGMDNRLTRTFSYNNFPTIPAILVSNNNTKEDNKYSLIYAKSVVNTLPSANFFRKSRLLPLQYIIDKSINSFDGSKFINNRPLKRLYDILDSGHIIPMVLDIGDMEQCATKYSVNWYDIIFEELPVWSFSIHVDCHHAFGLPFSYNWNEGPLHTNSSEWDSVFKTSDQSYPWINKERIAVWRGGGGGRGWRQRMVEISSDNPLVDAQIVDKGQRIPFQDFQKYRAVIDVDGNSWSERFNKLLCMNSPVIKVQPKFMNYIDITAKPHMHFIPAPLNESLNNVVNWTLAKENEEIVRNIMINARAWCRKHMTLINVKEDFVFQLAAYVELLDSGSSNWVDEMVEWQWKNGTAYNKLFESK